MKLLGRNLITRNLTATIDRAGTIARPAATGTNHGPAWSHNIA